MSFVLFGHSHRGHLRQTTERLRPSRIQACTAPIQNFVSTTLRHHALGTRPRRSFTFASDLSKVLLIDTGFGLPTDRTSPASETKEDEVTQGAWTDDPQRRDPK
jgi:hypothetical protein